MPSSISLCGLCAATILGLFASQPQSVSIVQADEIRSMKQAVARGEPSRFLSDPAWWARFAAFEVEAPPNLDEALDALKQLADVSAKSFDSDVLTGRAPVRAGDVLCAQAVHTIWTASRSIDWLSKVDDDEEASVTLRSVCLYVRMRSIDEAELGVFASEAEKLQEQFPDPRTESARKAGFAAAFVLGVFEERAPVSLSDRYAVLVELAADAFDWISSAEVATEVSMRLQKDNGSGRAPMDKPVLFRSGRDMVSPVASWARARLCAASGSDPGGVAKSVHDAKLSKSMGIGPSEDGLTYEYADVSDLFAPKMRTILVQQALTAEAKAWYAVMDTTDK